MAEKEKNRGNKKVEVGGEVKEERSGNGRRKPIESVNLFTSAGVLTFSVWEGGSISVRVSRRKDDNPDEYMTIWQGRINPVDFISQFGELKAVAKAAQDEVKKVLGTEI